jgi:hypothetical protein
VSEQLSLKSANQFVWWTCSFNVGVQLTPDNIQRIVHAISNAVFLNWLEHVPQHPANLPWPCPAITAK